MAVAPTIDLPSQWVLWWKVPIELARSRVRLLSLWHPSHHFLHGDRSLPLWPGWAPRWGRAQWRRRRHRTRASCQTRWKARGSHRSQREDPLENPNRVIIVNLLPINGPKVVPTPFIVSIHERTEHSLTMSRENGQQIWFSPEYLPIPPLFLARGRTAEFMAASPTAVRPLEVELIIWNSSRSISE